MFRTKVFWTLAMVTCVGAAGCTASAVAGSPSMAPATVASVADRALRSTDLLQKSMPSNEPGCSVAVGIDGKVVWADTSGLADVAAWTPLTIDDRYDIASVAEQFTGTAILLLAQQGKLALTDPVSAHVPDLPAWGDRVTIADLLHHTSGIGDVNAQLFGAGYTAHDPVTQHDALAQLAKLDELRFEPGTVFEFQDTNYLLLGEVVHTASGQEYPDYLRDNLFGPLGLDISVGPVAGDTMPTGYTTTLGKVVTDHGDWLMFGPGYLVTTPSELVRWADNYRTGQVGGPDLLAAQTADAFPMTSAPNTERIGAGIVITDDGTLEANGWTWGQNAEFLVAPDRHTSIAVACNRNDNQDAQMALMTKLRDIWV